MNFCLVSFCASQKERKVRFYRSPFPELLITTIYRLLFIYFSHQVNFSALNNGKSMAQCVTGITWLEWFMPCRNCQKCKHNTFLLMTFTFLSFKLTYPGISKSFFPFIFRVTLRLVHLIERLFYALWVVGRTESFSKLSSAQRECLSWQNILSFFAFYSVCIFQVLRMPWTWKERKMCSLLMGSKQLCYLSWPLSNYLGQYLPSLKVFSLESFLGL